MRSKNKPAFSAVRALLVTVGAALLLSACMTPAELQDPEGTAPASPAPQVLAPVVQINPSSVTPLPVPANRPAIDALSSVLSYADRIRTFSSAELNAEVGRLADKPAPAEQLQLSLALGQLRQFNELVRAQDLVARVLVNTSLEAQPLQPLARLLATRYAEQRRLEDQLEKQVQQTREVQRKLDQTTERLEALKAIERSLSSRPVPVPAPPLAPASKPVSSRSRVRLAAP